MRDLLIVGMLGVAIAAVWAAWRDASRARRDDDAGELARRHRKRDKS